MPADLLLAFTAFALVMSGTPGPNIMLVTASGVNYGFRATIPHMFGVTVGFSVMLLAVGFGLGRVFEALPELYTVLKIASVIYLCWLAWKIMSTKPAAAGDGRSAGTPMTFLQGAAFQWVNPKAWAICLSVIAAYTVPNNFLTSMLIMAALFVVINFVCLVVWCGFGVGLRSILQDPKRVRVFNVVMALLLLASMVPVLMR